MNSYKSLFSKGVNYAYRSLSIWNKRKERLNKMLPHHLPNPCRIADLGKELDERIESIIAFLAKDSQRRKRAEQTAENEIIELICTDLLCGMEKKKLTLYVALQDYVPSKFRCPRCRTTLCTVEDLEINMILEELDITFNG